MSRWKRRKDRRERIAKVMEDRGSRLGPLGIRKKKRKWGRERLKLREEGDTVRDEEIDHVAELFQKAYTKESDGAGVEDEEIDRVAELLKKAYSGEEVGVGDNEIDRMTELLKKAYTKEGASKRER